MKRIKKNIREFEEVYIDFLNKDRDRMLRILQGEPTDQDITDMAKAFLIIYAIIGFLIWVWVKS